MNKQILSKKEETKNRMIDAAGRSFREFGYGGIGVDGIAKAAGVTSGAFYAHLGSKNAAFNISVSVGLDEVIAAVPHYRSEYGKDWVKAFAEYYLGKTHRDDLACGCAMASLTPEVVKGEDETQLIYETKMKIISSLMADGLVGESAQNCLERAWAMLSVLIGGLNIARAMKSDELSEEIAKTVIGAAIQIAGSVKSE